MRTPSILCRSVLCLSFLLIPLSPALAADAKAGDEKKVEDLPKAKAEPLKRTKLGIELNKRTLIFTGPVRDDGTIDYIAAFNKHLSKGVTKDNNAFRDLFLLFSQKDEDGRWKDNETRYVPGMLKALGLKEADLARGPQLMDPEAYLIKRGHSRLEAEQLVEQVWGPMPKAGYHADLVKWLTAMEPVFQRAVKAVEKPKWWAPLVAGDEAGLLTFVAINHLGDQRLLARGLKARALHAALMGRHGKAVESVRAIRRLAYLQGKDAYLLTAFVADAIDRVAVNTLEKMLSMRVLPEKALAQLAKDWVSIPRGSSMSHYIEFGERACMLDSYMQLFAGRLSKDAGFEGLEVLAGKEGIKGYDINIGLRKFSHKLRLYARILEADKFAARQRMSEKFRNQLDQEFEALAKKYKNEVGGETVPNPKVLLALVSGKPRGELLTDATYAMLFPAVGAVYKVEARSQARRDSAFTAIAVERYRLKHKKLPAKLSELVPAYLDKVPTDPFSEKPLIYRIKGEGFRVYAVGDDFKDNGGINEENEDDQQDWGVIVEWAKKK